MDDEIKGKGNSYDFGARMYDSRVGRWWSVDPLSKDYPMLSDYVMVDNNPIKLVDKDGKKILIDDGQGNTYEYKPGALAPDQASDFVKETFKNLNNIIEKDVSKDHKAMTAALALVNDDRILGLREIKVGEEMGYNSRTEKLSDGQKTKLGVVTVNNNLLIESAELDKAGDPIILNKNADSPYKGSGKFFKADRLLFHELLHANHKNFNFKRFKEERINKRTRTKGINEKRWTNREEKRTIEEMNEITGEVRNTHKANKIK